MRAFMMLPFSLRRAATRPIPWSASNSRIRIYRQLLDAVLDGRLRAGERLPPPRELALRLDVSRNTVTVAYEWLAAEGYLSGRIGAGTFVSAEPLSQVRARRAPSGAVRPRRLWESMSTPAHVQSGAPAYDFRVGIPDAQLFPLATWRRLITRELRPAAVRSAAYGESSGHAGLRTAIARHVGLSRAVRAVRA
jgi:GntR family transcriptional regulator/MocR family aminotransferase